MLAHSINTTRGNLSTPWVLQTLLIKPFIEYQILIEKSELLVNRPLGGIPYFVAVIPEEVSGQLFHALHIAGLDGVGEAQRLEGEGLHGFLNQLDVSTSTCAIGLEERRAQQSCGSASSQMLMTICFCVGMLFTHEELDRMIREREKGGHAAKDHGQKSNPGRCSKD